MTQKYEKSSIYGKIMGKIWKNKGKEVTLHPQF